MYASLYKIKTKTAGKIVEKNKNMMMHCTFINIEWECNGVYTERCDGDILKRKSKKIRGGGRSSLEQRLDSMRGQLKPFFIFVIISLPSTEIENMNGL